MADIFISYAREDRTRIEPLAKSLEKLGWSVWWDWTIPVGKTWRQVISEELEAAACVVVAWSDKSIKSNWVIEEAEEGSAKNILTPVLIADVRPPMGFRQIQAASLVNWRGEPEDPEFKKLLHAAESILGSPKRKEKAEPVAPPTRPSVAPLERLSVAEPSIMKSLSKMRVLLVDDDKFEMAPLIYHLEEQGAKVFQVTNGSAALAYLKNEPLPDLIILDMMMPEGGDDITTDDEGRSTGIKVYEKIRYDLKLAIPIISSTVVNDPKYRELYSREPSDQKLRVLIKPYTMIALDEAIAAITV